MANILKKLIAGISTAAILATMSVPVMASTSLADIDYSADGETNAGWTAGGNTTITVTSGELRILNTSSNGARASYYKFTDSAITDAVELEYDVKFYNPGDPTTVWVGGTSSSSPVASIAFGAIRNDASVNVNGTVNGDATKTFQVTGSYRATPWLHVKQTIVASGKTVNTVITIDGVDDPLYSSNDAYTVTTGITSIGANVGRGGSNYVAFKNLKITQLEVPTITLETVSSVEVGSRVKVASASVDINEEDVSVSNPSSFSVEVEGTDVYLTALDTANSGDETTVTVTAVGETSVTKTTEAIKAYSTQEIVENAAAAIEPSGYTVQRQEGDVYTAVGSFNLPVEYGDAIITWVSDDESITVDDEGNVGISSDYRGSFELTAAVTYKEISVKKSSRLKCL